MTSGDSAEQKSQRVWLEACVVGWSGHSSRHGEDTGNRRVRSGFAGRTLTQ
jgi:hypothetical protein